MSTKHNSHNHPIVTGYMAPDTIEPTTTHDHAYLFSLILIVNLLSPTLKVLISLKGKLLSNPAHTASTNVMDISTIGKDPVPVYIMEIAPANALIHRKAASFEHLVWTVSTLNGLHISSKSIHLIIQKLSVDTISALQEAQSVYNSLRDCVICIATLEPQVFLHGNMDEVTIDMSNEPAKRSLRIKLMRFCCTTKESDLDSRISPGIASSFEFCLSPSFSRFSNEVSQQWCPLQS